jgi:hypothetical protein
MRKGVLTMISHLFKNGIIVTVNPDREIFFHGAVAVKDDRIVEVGPTEAMEAKYTDCDGPGGQGNVPRLCEHPQPFVPDPASGTGR